MTNLNVRETQSTSVELTWGPVNEIDRNGIINLYNVRYRLSGTSNPYVLLPGGVTERVSNVYLTV